MLRPVYAEHRPQAEACNRELIVATIGECVDTSGLFHVKQALHAGVSCWLWQTALMHQESLTLVRRSGCDLTQVMRVVMREWSENAVDSVDTVVAYAGQDLFGDDVDAVCDPRRSP